MWVAVAGNFHGGQNSTAKTNICCNNNFPIWSLQQEELVLAHPNDCRLLCLLLPPLLRASIMYEIIETPNVRIAYVRTEKKSLNLFSPPDLLPEMLKSYSKKLENEQANASSFVHKTTSHVYHSLHLLGSHCNQFYPQLLCC